MKNFILFALFLCLHVKLYSQCGVCTSCTTSSSSGCTTTLSSSSSSNITVNSTDKLCITGGTFTGKLTFNGGTVVVNSGANFNPFMISVSGTTSLLEIKSGAAASLPGINISSSVSFTINVCGTATFSGDFKVTTSGTGNINNAGIITSTGDFLYSSGSSGTICNSGTLSFVNLSLSTSTNSIVNSGSMYLSGNMNLSNSASATLCAGSYAEVQGNWNASTGATMNAPTPCGKIKVHNSTNCSSCNVTGYVDMCDSSGAAMTNSPHVDNNSGGSWASTVTYCNPNSTCGFALPINLLYFNATAENNKVKLEWATASELNNNYFTVERSVDGWDYRDAVQVKGAGNSTENLSYVVYDEHPYAGVSYYRLRQTDYDGRTTASRPIAVEIKKMLIYPNPVADNLNLLIYSVNYRALFEIYNLAGQRLIEKTESLHNGQNSLQINVSNLAKGIYSLKMETDEGIVYEWFLKL